MHGFLEAQAFLARYERVNERKGLIDQVPAVYMYGGE
jgi:hypothetical protein